MKHGDKFYLQTFCLTNIIQIVRWGINHKVKCSPVLLQLQWEVTGWHDKTYIMLSSRRKQDGKKILYKWQTNHNRRRQLPLLVFKMITIMHMGGKLHGIKSLYKWGQWVIKERFLASHCGNRRANSYLANVVQLFNIFGVRYPNSTNS